MAFGGRQKRDTAAIAMQQRARQEENLRRGELETERKAVTGGGRNRETGRRQLLSRRASLAATLGTA